MKGAIKNPNRVNVSGVIRALLALPNFHARTPALKLNFWTFCPEIFVGENPPFWTFFMYFPKFNQKLVDVHALELKNIEQILKKTLLF